MTTKPTENDVLSGRGARFNQHPGNEHFRRRIEEQKSVYMTSTKKQKMDMSKAIAETFYSMEPPGRFLKQCPETGQWNELSKKDAADRVAQAMAYAVSGKEKSIRNRERRRQSRRSLPLPPSPQNVVDAASSRSVHRSAQLYLHSSKNNQMEGNVSSSVARHGTAARGSAAAVGTNFNAESAAKDDRHPDSAANELVRMPDNSNLQQQLLQQLLQSNTTALPPTTSGAALNMNQNGLVQVLAQALQQQQLQQLQYQQLPLQHTLGPNPLGQFQTTQQLSPASLVGLTQMLAQAQQQEQQQQQQQQQLILLQRLLNQQNVLSSASLPPASSSSTSFSSPQGALPTNNILFNKQSQLANRNNLFKNQVQPQSHTSTALSLNNVLSNLQSQPNNIGISNSPRGAQQLDQLQRSLMMQQQQLLASSLGASLSNHLPLQQQQPRPFDPLFQQAWQTALQLQQNSQGGLPPPPINVAASASAANAAAQMTEQEGSADEEQIGSK